MSPIQQMLLGVGAVATKTYVDDVFSTFLYTGNGSDNRVVTNNIDLAAEGGLVWVKNRDNSTAHYLTDTVRGVSKGLRSNNSNAETTSTVDALKSFTSTGFTVGTGGNVNETNADLASWTFRKSPMFDVVNWTGNSDTNQTISHSLSSIPGLIIAKRTDSSTTGDWVVYHRDHEGYLKLNSTAAAVSDSGAWTPVTSTSFKAYDYINVNGASYVAYLFAGGESTAAAARSVELDGSGDYLSLASSDDFHLTGDFTIEGWFYLKQSSSVEALWSIGTFNSTGGVLCYINNNLFYIYNHSTNYLGISKIPALNQWTHIAVVRSGTTVSVYFDGVFIDSYTFSNDFGSSSNKTFYVGGNSDGDSFEGKISNFRVVKGTAVYTSSFRPPTEPLTNITNTKLLCCNNSSVTGKTTGGTITANGDPTASSNSPFDDPAGFVFGDAADQNVVKCGSFIGNHTNLPEINLGFEPQFLLWKNAEQNQDWFMIDSMRGVVTGGNDARLRPNQNYADNSSQNPFEFTPTGFKCTTSDNNTNGVGENTIFLAIRRPDGYCGKPCELGTDVFNLATGGSDNVKPTFETGFPVDFNIYRPLTTSSWVTGARLLGKNILYTDSTGSQQTTSTYEWNFNTGMGNWTGDQSAYKSWNWKRHAGFDCICYDGLSGVREIPHSLGKPAEMIFIKRRDGSEEWAVGHKGMDSGGWNKYMKLNSSDAEANAYGTFNSTAPTATHFSLSTSSRANLTGQTYIAMLFASTDVSSVGSYTGNGASGQTITTGFQPRFIIIKNIDQSGKSWMVLDTVRGWAAGNDNYLQLNDSAAQASHDFGNPTSTGFYLHGGGSTYNGSGTNYIYYAHS